MLRFIVFILLSIFYVTDSLGVHGLGPSPPSEPNVNRNTVKVSETWEHYWNKEVGFSISYPPRHISVQEFGQIIRFDRKKSQNKGEQVYEPHASTFMYISFDEIPKESKDSGIEEILRKHLHLEEFKEFDRKKDEIWDYDLISKWSFNGTHDGYLVHRWLQAVGECSYYAISNHHLLSVSRNRVGLTASKCDGDSLFNSILATLTFGNRKKAK